MMEVINNSKSEILGIPYHTLYPYVVLTCSYQSPAAPPVETPAISPVPGQQLMCSDVFFLLILSVITFHYIYQHLKLCFGPSKSVKTLPPSQLGCDLPIAVCLQHAALLVPAVPQPKKFIHGISRNIEVCCWTIGCVLYIHDSMHPLNVQDKSCIMYECRFYETNQSKIVKGISLCLCLQQVKKQVAILRLF